MTRGEFAKKKKTDKKDTRRRNGSGNGELKKKMTKCDIGGSGSKILRVAYV